MIHCIDYLQQLHTVIQLQQQARRMCSVGHQLPRGYREQEMGAHGGVVVVLLLQDSSHTHSVISGWLSACTHVSVQVEWREGGLTEGHLQEEVVRNMVM